MSILGLIFFAVIEIGGAHFGNGSAGIQSQQPQWRQPYFAISRLLDLFCFFPQTVCPHWGVLRVVVKTGLWPPAFCCQFSRQVALVRFPCAFRPRRLAQNAGPDVGSRHLFCKLLHNMALVRCPCAFRLRRFAQNGVTGHFSCSFPHKMALVCASLRKKGVPFFGRGIFLVISRMTWLLCRLAQNGPRSWGAAFFL